MLYEYTLKTDREGFYNITAQILDAIGKSGVKEGICVVYCPHTTAGITINENADPDVVRDMLLGLSKAFPDRPEFRHSEGNSHAHLKSSCVGVSQTLIVNDGNWCRGVWQTVYFCEFDGPRTRTFFVEVRG
ncbi:MAG: secondary thiamine-phosphate synthase enzyme YjbQ [Thermoguttaceae bacterium]